MKIKEIAKETQLDIAKTKTQAKENFNKHLIHKNAIATNDIRSENFDLDKARDRSNEALIALNAQDGLQAMLVSQMISIHELQQTTMAFANGCSALELKKFYTNSAIKLSNCFTQQANILAKLQGVGGQKIIVERVDVHQGGQAIVGNIQGSMGNKEKT
ncbi:hypothetical protein QHW22_14490 [Legionella pneumophila]|uniref:hypothetical protein n=1 Tax=Legionella pneumophila TaxID=446 RepID=UPI00067F26A4|nr:hypothetical protein [Legionella pneumophila]AOW59545.1 hypothetical protein BE843_04710 [Legionella pneumophila subsp. pneumophila]AOW62533.1 hypothetical protein BE844_14075 [Legionella pneumophila subsp. pneumophila]AOW68315.1 hypothetical protein BE846_11830 [Legionella pneumophila subsp. pneumophila]MCK0183492.1 hypothetical protein [Legionella pneumophila]MCK1881062.1 hypothetical protein [Legionella pneumophila]